VLVLVSKIPNGLHRRMLRRLDAPTGPYAQHPERAGEAVCEKILAEVAPPPSATGWRREWSRGHRGPRLTFDDLSVRSGGVI
jgi:hypothetical protein